MPLKIAHRIKIREEVDNSIPLNTFQWGLSNFTVCFSRNGGSVPGWSDPIAFEWKHLEALFPAEPHAPLAIAIYHGLDPATHKLVHGFRVVARKNENDGECDLDPQLDTLAGDYPTHILQREAAGGPPFTSVKDRAHWLPYASAYAQEVLVDRVGSGAPVNINPAHDDPRSVTFAWEDELRLLKEHNMQVFLNGTYQVVLSNFSLFHGEGYTNTWFQGPAGLRHGLCFHMRVSHDGGVTWEDMLNNADEVSVYMNKGADIGSMCPPRCRRFSSSKVKGQALHAMEPTNGAAMTP